MKKVLCSLVVLAILVGMFVCLGVQAFAAEGAGGLAIVAVAGDVLTAEQIGMIKESQSDKNVVVIDINGLDFEQSGEGYSYVYADVDQGPAPGGYEFIWPGMGAAPTCDVADGAGAQCKVVFLPVGPEDQTDAINATVDAYKLEGACVVIAIAPDTCYNAQAAVDSNVDKVLTCGESGVSGDKVVQVGESGAPVSLITVTASGSVEATNMSLPQAADPNVDPGEGESEDEGSSNGISNMLPPGLPSGSDDDPGDPSADGGTQPPEPTEVPVEHTPEPTEEPVETYDVIFSANADPHTGVVADQYDLAPNSQIQLPENGYSRDGYEFAGWDVNGETKQPYDTITVTGDMQISAVWNQITLPAAPQFYTVTYKSGVEGLEDVTEAASPNQQITLAGCPAEWVYEGHKFDGWKLKSAQTPEDQMYTAGSAYPAEGGVTGELVFVAQWSESVSDSTSTPEPETSEEPGNGGLQNPMLPGPEITTYNVTYSDGGSNTVSAEPAKEGDTITVAANAFPAPAESKCFTGWKDQNGTDYAPGASYTMTAADVTFTAQWGDRPVISFNANGGTGEMANVYWDLNGTFTVPNCNFTREGYNFASWQLGEQSYQPGGTFTVTENVTLTANWTEIPAADPGHVDTLMWTTGGTDPLYFSYNLPVATISMDGSLLAENTHYVLSNGGKTIQLLNSYLDALTAGEHRIDITFTAANGDVAVASDKVETVTISVKAPDPIQTAVPETTQAPNVKEVTWADRTQELWVDFASAPQKLYINYGSNGLKEATLNTDYSVKDLRLTLKPDMVNKNRGVWNNGLYGFVVTLADGSNVTLKVTLAGTAPAASTPTPVGGNSPVTGDSNNIVLYVVLLAVLVLALAVVLIIMVKRRKGGQR